LNQLSNLIVDQVSSCLKLKFIFNQAFSFYNQQKYMEAISSFENVLSNSNNQKSKLEIIRYLIECYLCINDKKSEAIKLSETYTDLDPLCNILINYHTKSPNLIQLFEK
jgi:hypothetical protein